MKLHLTVHVLMGPKSWKTTKDSQVWLPGPTFRLPLSDPLAYVPNYFWNGTRSRSCWPTRRCISDVPVPFDVQQDAHVFLSTFPLHWLRAAWPPFGTIGELRRTRTTLPCLNMGALSSCHSHATDIFHHPSPPHLSTARLCFCQYSHLSTKTYLHYESFLPSNIWSFLDGSWRSLCFGCDLRQWRRGACRSDYNTTSARLSMAWKMLHTHA